MRWWLVVVLAGCAQTPKESSPYLAPNDRVLCDAELGDVTPALARAPLHRGACGACSNARDLRVYRRTRSTLTGFATRCAVEEMLFGGGGRCIDDKIGFTDGCRDCWLENMRCTAARCRGVCLATALTGTPKVDDEGALNPCLACDERECGTAFVACAGATRRGAGIETDITRPGDQMWRGVE